MLVQVVQNLKDISISVLFDLSKDFEEFLPLEDNKSRRPYFTVKPLSKRDSLVFAIKRSSEYLGTDYTKIAQYRLVNSVFGCTIGRQMVRQLIRSNALSKELRIQLWLKLTCQVLPE